MKNAKLIIESWRARGFGMLSLRDGLGVFASSADNVKSCPAGWLFIDLDRLSDEDIERAVDDLKEGRKSWPK
jgi:hypothetical protein